MDNTNETRGKLFRKSVGGYNKDDVNGYILKINSRFGELEESCKKESDSLRARLCELEAENARLRLENEALSEDISSRDSVSAEELSAANEKAESAERLLEAMRESLDKLTEERTALAEQAENIARASAEELLEANRAQEALRLENEELRAKLASAPAVAEARPEDAEKLRKYDEISSKIGEMMIFASTDAERIKTQAADHANFIIKEAEAKAEHILADAGRQSSETMAKIKEAGRRYRDELNRLCEKYTSIITGEAEDENTASLLGISEFIDIK